MLYLLDTNILIAAMKGHPAVRDRLEALPLNDLRLSAIVLGELEFGAEKSAHGERNRARLAALAQRLPWSASMRQPPSTMLRSELCWNGKEHPSAPTTLGSQRKHSPARRRW